VFKRILKQSNWIPTWLGGFLIQLQQSLVYVALANVAMLAVTMWYSAGFEISQKYLPILTIWHFLLIIVVGWMLLIFIDYKYLTPARMRFSNKQAVVHTNPNTLMLETLIEEAKILKADNVELKALVEKLIDDKKN